MTDDKASLAARAAAKTHGVWLGGAREEQRDLIRARAARLHAAGSSTEGRWHQHEDLRAWSLARTDASDDEMARPPIVYLHGGAHLLGAADDVASRRLALATSRPVISVAYPLAPEHPHPAALTALGHLPGLVDACLRRLPGHRGPETWDLVASSTGAMVALGWMLRTYTGAGPIADQSAEVWPLSRHPRRLVLLSPWVDPRGRGASRGLEAEDAALQPGWLPEAAMLLHAGGTDLRDPELSVVDGPYADVADGSWPLTLIVSATGDRLLSDAVLLHRRLRDAGHPSRLELWDGPGHDFVSDTELSQAEAAWTDVGAFLG